MDNNSLLQSFIIEAYKNQKNKKHIHVYNIKQEGENALCGDSITFYVNVVDDIVKDVGYDAKGCVISQVFTSVLSEYMIGKNWSNILNVVSFDDIYSSIGVTLSPTRLKCAKLPFETIKLALTEK
jgi:nitrogen fixation NifU-like protein